MSNSIDLSVRVSVLPETHKGLNYRAVINTEKCKVSGERIKICEGNAIYEGPGRMPKLISWCHHRIGAGQVRGGPR